MRPASFVPFFIALAYSAQAGKPATFHPGDEALPQETSSTPRAAAASTVGDLEQTVGFLNVSHPGETLLLGSPFITSDASVPGEEFLKAGGVTALWRTVGGNRMAYEPSSDRSRWLRSGAGDPLPASAPLEAYHVEAEPGTTIRFYGRVRPEPSYELQVLPGDHALAAPWPVGPLDPAISVTPPPSPDPVTADVLLMIQKGGGLQPYYHVPSTNEWQSLSFQPVPLDRTTLPAGSGFLLAIQGESRVIRWERMNP